MVKKPAKKAAKPAAKKPEPKGIEITADEIHGLPMGAARKGDRPDVLPEVADLLVKEGLAKRV
jgi:hypothetical protein